MIQHELNKLLGLGTAVAGMVSDQRQKKIALQREQSKAAEAEATKAERKVLQEAKLKTEATRQELTEQRIATEKERQGTEQSKQEWNKQRASKTEAQKGTAEARTEAIKSKAQATSTDPDIVSGVQQRVSTRQAQKDALKQRLAIFGNPKSVETLSEKMTADFRKESK